MKRRYYDPDHCAACGEFLPCGESLIPTPSDLRTTDQTDRPEQGDAS